MNYPKVNRAHVIPATYLRSFADDQRIAMRLVGDSEIRVASVKDVGIRKRFYSRTRHDGERIDDVEWSLSMLEGEATPVLREVEQRWPLSPSDKADLAEFFAAQHVRGPRWRRHHKEFIDQEIEGWRAGENIDGLSRQPTEEELANAKQALGWDTQMLVRMLSLIPKVKTLFGSMHWSLIRFDSHALAVSDHPVVSWPIAVGPREPEPGSYRTGLLPTREWFVPVSSKLALLMTWLDDIDTPKPIAGALHHAKTMNAFVVARADEQWFHHPDARPKLGSGRLAPLSSSALEGYSAARAQGSRRREKVSQILNAKVGSTLDKEARIVIVNRKQ